MVSEGILGLSHYEITKIDGDGGTVHISARYTGAVACPDCSSEQLRSKGCYVRTVVCIDLAPNYSTLMRKHFPNARIVADRFHVIRLVNHHFLNCWRDLDAVSSKNRGVLSLMRHHRHNLKPEQFEKLTAHFRS